MEPIGIRSASSGTIYACGHKNASWRVHNDVNHGSVKIPSKLALAVASQLGTALV